MKMIRFTFLIAMITLLILPSLGQAPEFYAENNNMALSYEFDKEKLRFDTQDASGGLMFSCSYVMGGGGVHPIKFLSLHIGDVEPMSLSFFGPQLLITRKVKWQECLQWTDGDNGACNQLGTAAIADMQYYTWDNVLMPEAGWLSVEITDSGLIIKTSNNGPNGPYLSDFTYAGLHFSAIEDIVGAHVLKKVRLDIPSAATLGTSLSGITVFAGNLRYADGVKIVQTPPPYQPGEDSSPRTAYPNAHGSGAAQRLKDPTEENNIFLEESAQEPVMLYPNPATGNVFLHTTSPKGAPLFLHLYDLRGRMVDVYPIPSTAGGVPAEVVLDRNRVGAGMVMYEVLHQRGVSRGKLLLQ